MSAPRSNQISIGLSNATIDIQFKPTRSISTFRSTVQTDLSVKVDDEDTKTTITAEGFDNDDKVLSFLNSIREEYATVKEKPHYDPSKILINGHIRLATEEIHAQAKTQLQTLKEAAMKRLKELQGAGLSDPSLQKVPKYSKLWDLVQERAPSGTRSGLKGGVFFAIIQTTSDQERTNLNMIGTVIDHLFTKRKSIKVNKPRS